MQIFIYSQWEYLFYSLILGISLGMIYDVVCILPYALRQKKGYSFISDLIFSIVWGALTLIVAYSKNFGSYRLYSFLGSLGSFFLYRATLGSLICHIEVFVFKKIYSFCSYIMLILNNTIDIFIKFVKIRVRNRKIKSYSKKLLADAEKGFDRKEYYERTVH